MSELTEIKNMVASYDQNPTSLASPDISKNLLQFLRTVISAKVVDSVVGDPLLSLGRRKQLMLKNHSGDRRIVLLWGNADGWGIEDITGEA